MSLGGLFSLPVARATMRERGPVFLPAGLAVLMTLAGTSNAYGSGWAGETFSGFAGFFLIGLTMALGAGLISDEIDSGHAQLVLLRPLTRAEWFGGRLVGAGAVLAGAIFVTWLCGGLSVVATRRGGLDVAWAVTLPLTIIEGLAWLSTLAMMSVFLARWMNVGALLMLIMTFFFLMFTLPLAIGRPGLMDTLRSVNRFLGPQGMGELLRQVRKGTRPDLSPVFYDLLWMFGCWLAGALLLNRREIARRQK